MKETLYDLAYHVFYDTAQKTAADVDFNLSNHLEYPKIKFVTRNHVIIPNPTEFNGMYFFEGHIFDDYDEYKDSIWSLFLASIYHTAAHIKVSNFTQYEYWMQNKTPEKGWRVIDYVEDIKVEQYLKNLYPEAWENISKINKTYDKLYKSNISKNSGKSARNAFSNYYSVNKSKELSELNKKLLQTENIEFDEIIPYLDFLYKNQHLLPENIPPYCEDHEFTKHGQPITNMRIVPKGEFKRFTEAIDELWVREKIRSNRMIKAYEKYAKNLNFDEIKINPENFGEYLRIKNECSALIRKLRNQLQTVSNSMDSPVSEDLGMMELQKAIQREASQNESIQVFEQDDVSRQNENWVVIFDTSASMKLKFENMKYLSFCLCETADELSARGGKWGMYSFNNNFLVVKDQSEKYDQKVKSRIGGIKNQGLSFIPDAITIGTRILDSDYTCEKKYLIIITDGIAMGYDNMDKNMKEAIKLANKSGINIIGIGVREGVAKYFMSTINEETLRKSVSKFIDSYTAIARSQM